MFSAKRVGSDDRGRARAVRPADTTKRGMFSVIGADVIVAGNLNASSDLHIEGHVDGDVICNAVIQGAESRITGSITAETARLAGSVEGSVRVRHLTVETGARIAGDIEYETIAIEQGGQVDGRLTHVGGVAACQPAILTVAPPAATSIVTSQAA